MVNRTRTDAAGAASRSRSRAIAPLVIMLVLAGAADGLAQSKSGGSGSAGVSEATEADDFWLEIGGCTDLDEVLLYLTLFSEGPNAEEAKTCIEAAEKDELVFRLLRECRAHQDAHRLTPGGIGGNALECYRRVLDEDPGNAEALQGINEIEQHYLDRAQAELDAGQLPTARNSIDRLAMINPEHPAVAGMRSRLRDLEDGLERVEALGVQVQEFLAGGEFEEARRVVEEARAEMPGVAELESLAAQVEAAARTVEIRRQEELLAEARGLFEEGDLAGAWERLEEARDIGGKSVGDELATQIAEAEAARAAERDRLKAEAERSLVEEQFSAARENLADAVALGLPESEAEDLRERINSAEAQSRDRWIAERLAVCLGLEGRESHAEATQCYQEILEIDPNRSQAREGLQRGSLRAAWSMARERGTVEGYFQFETDFPETNLALLARLRINRMEEEFWLATEETNTVEAYERYSEIFPNGPNVDVALERACPDGGIC